MKECLFGSEKSSAKEGIYFCRVVITQQMESLAFWLAATAVKAAGELLLALQKKVALGTAAVDPQNNTEYIFSAVFFLFLDQLKENNRRTASEFKILFTIFDAFAGGNVVFCMENLFYEIRAENRIKIG